MRTLVLADADWVIAFDGRGHRLLRNGTVAMQGDTITYVGREYRGPRDEVIDARGRIVLPGLLDLHTHLALEARTKGFSDDHGSRQLWMSGLFEYLPAMGLFDRPDDPGFDREGVLDALRFAVVELLKGGATSVFDMGWVSDETLEVLEASGLRVWVGPVIRSGRWYTRNGHAVEYEWDLERGRRTFRAALQFIERRSGDWGGRLQGALIPAGPDTVEPAPAARNHGRGRAPRRPGADPRGPERARALGDDAAARPDADPVSRRTRHGGPAGAPRTCRPPGAPQ